MLFDLQPKVVLTEYLHFEYLSSNIYRWNLQEKSLLAPVLFELSAASCLSEWMLVFLPQPGGCEPCKQTAKKQ